MSIAFCDQADLELAVGGAKELKQLSDPNNTGIADADRITDYLEAGAAEVRSALEVKHEPETIAQLDSNSLRRLRDANAALSARVAWVKGARGRAMPPQLAEAADRADKFLDDLALGRRRLGRVAGGRAASLGQPAGVVDFDSCGSGISMTGFKKGFR